MVILLVEISHSNPTSYLKGRAMKNCLEEICLDFVNRVVIFILSYGFS